MPKPTFFPKHVFELVLVLWRLSLNRKCEEALSVTVNLLSSSGLVLEVGVGVGNRKVSTYCTMIKWTGMHTSYRRPGEQLSVICTLRWAIFQTIQIEYSFMAGSSYMLTSNFPFSYLNPLNAGVKDVYFGHWTWPKFSYLTLERGRKISLSYHILHKPTLKWFCILKKQVGSVVGRLTCEVCQSALKTVQR